MKVQLESLKIITRKTVETLEFSPSVTFLYGPLGTGKSTVARLIDYCLGGDLERTPAVQNEFVSVQLFVQLGSHQCTLERSATDTQSVRVSWGRNEEDAESVNAPLDAGPFPVVGDEIYNLSDLLFHLCGAVPIKVRKRARDPDSPMVRLSFRDIWWYCYLDQTHLDSSFFKLEDPFRGRKSQDAMRFFTGLHSERLSQLETDLYRAIDDQKGKREAANQIRRFMDRFELGSEVDVDSQIESARRELLESEFKRQQLEQDRSSTIHPTDPLRVRLREMSEEVAEIRNAISETDAAIAEQRALRAELITTKLKADRAEQAGQLLAGVEYLKCPECASDLSTRSEAAGVCRLCCTHLGDRPAVSSLELEAIRRELNDRIDQITESLQRRERALERSVRQLQTITAEKANLDRMLQQELARYDSSFVENIRAVDRENATLSERIRSLEKLRQMPLAITELEEQATQLQLKIDRVRIAIEREVERLRQADDNVAAIAERFKAIMIQVGFPGVSATDEVLIDTRTWKPTIFHEGQEWTFWDAGSGGKKTLFNVCYALALHEAAMERGMPVPSVLVIDSPTKNISEDENPALVAALYEEIYRLVSRSDVAQIQLLLIDSNLVKPNEGFADFTSRHLAGDPDAPSLIPYYVGP